MQNMRADIAEYLTRFHPPENYKIGTLLLLADKQTLLIMTEDGWQIVTPN